MLDVLDSLTNPVPWRKPSSAGSCGSYANPGLLRAWHTRCTARSGGPRSGSCGPAAYAVSLRPPCPATTHRPSRCGARC